MGYYIPSGAVTRGAHVSLETHHVLATRIKEAGRSHERGAAELKRHSDNRVRLRPIDVTRNNLGIRGCAANRRQ